MKKLTILEDLKQQKDLLSVFSPEKYVFNEEEIQRTFCKRMTKTQQRKYFNAYKSADNLIQNQGFLSEEDFATELKKLAVLYPIMASKDIPREFLEVINHVLRKLFEKNAKDTVYAQKSFSAFVRFYETIIAYSRDK